MTRTRLGVVGVGHLGKEHARILSQMPDVELVGVAEPRAVQANAVAQRCSTRAYADYRDLVSKVDGVVIAAPTAQHHAIASAFLERGIHVLVEKPICAELGPAEELLALAERRKVVLQVGHVERFNPAFEELQSRALTPKFIDCERCSGFSGRSTDVGAVLDIMIHDLDLVLALVQAPVRSVEAMGVAVLGGHEDLARATVTFANGCVAQFSTSRVHSAPVRRMNVLGPEGFVAVDFAKRQLTMTQPNRKLIHPDFDSRRLDPGTLESVRTELFSRYLQTCEFECEPCDQLTQELGNFVHCMRTGEQPRVDGVAGRDAIALAMQILDKIRRHAWEGNASGPCGPHELPPPAGTLFAVQESESRAA